MFITFYSSNFCLKDFNLFFNKPAFALKYDRLLICSCTHTHTHTHTHIHTFYSPELKFQKQSEFDPFSSDLSTHHQCFDRKVLGKCVFLTKRGQNRVTKGVHMIRPALIPYSYTEMLLSGVKSMFHLSVSI